MQIEDFEKFIPKEKIFKDELMSKHTSFKIGGPAEYFIVIEDAEQLKNILKLANKEKQKITVIGNGTNLLVKDKGIKGIVLKINIKKFEMTQENNDIKIIVGSGNKLGELAQKLTMQEITGMEFSAGIPGTIGGAIRMNAGAHGSEMKDIIKKITYMDRNGEIYSISNQDAEFEYRKSLFCRKDYIILEAELQLKKGKKEEIQSKMKEYAEFRKEKQPIEFPSAGSTFKRGNDFITAKLIDECGLKGYQIGGAQISEKHAGFIINTGNATAEDVIQLIEYTKKQVNDKFGKKIEREIEII